MRNETLAATWQRRAISIGAYAALCVVLIALFPLLLLLALATDAIRPRRLAATRLLIFLVFFLAMEMAGVAAATLLWIRHTIGFANRDAFLDANFRLQCWWASRLARTGMRIFGLRLDVRDAYAFSDRPIILFVRHASFADTVIAALLIGARHGIRLRYVMKRELLWDPCLDIVGHRLQNYFVKRADATSEEIAAVGRLAESLGPREGVLIYPEGTRFTPAKRDRILRSLHESGDTAECARAETLERVLPPRMGGTLALLRANTAADAVFCAHTGLEGSATLHDVLNGAFIGNTVRVAFWGIQFDAIPPEGPDRVAWFHDQWRAVDRWIAAHLEQIKAPSAQQPIQEAQ